MGIALWLACAAVVFFAARSVPYARPASWLTELAVTIISAIVLGCAATALDFGGWKELDWRAGLFVFFGTATFASAHRLVRILLAPAPASIK
jgi:hypothetical protein